MTKTADHPYEITIEDAGPARKRVCVTVPAETISSKMKDSMGAMVSQTVLPGFRKGKVPTHLLQKRFGDSIREEARKEIISDAWKSAVEEHGLVTLGDPEPVGDPADVVVEEGKPLTFSLEVEVMPEFELPAFDDIALTKPIIDITDEHVDEEMKRQSIRHGNLEDVEGKAGEGSFLVGPAVVHLDGKEDPFFKTEQTRLAIPPKDGSGQVLGLHIENLGEKIHGAAVSDEIVIEATGPDEHELEEIRGAKVVITFNVVQAIRVVPLSDEELMNFFGLDSIDNLKEQLKFALETRRDQDQASVLRRQATEALASRIEMDLPEKTTAMQAERDLQRLRTELQTSGTMTLEEVEAEVAKVRAGSAEESKSRLKSFFITSKLAEHFHVTVDDMEINGRISEIAGQNGVRPDEMRKTLEQQGQLSQIAAVVREDKATDQLVAACSVKDIPVDEWKKMQEDGASSSKKKTMNKSAAKKKTTKKKTKKKSAKSSSKS
jgi:trigger factor